MNNIESSFETHFLSIENRRQVRLTGIDDVLSFNEYEITMHSALGSLIIEGEQLKIDCFSSEKGTLDVSGKIDGIAYLDADTGKHARKKNTRR